MPTSGSDDDVAFTLGIGDADRDEMMPPLQHTQQGVSPTIRGATSAHTNEDGRPRMVARHLLHPPSLLQGGEVSELSPSIHIVPPLGGDFAESNSAVLNGSVQLESTPSTLLSPLPVMTASPETTPLDHLPPANKPVHVRPQPSAMPSRSTNTSMTMTGNTKMVSKRQEHLATLRQASSLVDSGKGGSEDSGTTLRHHTFGTARGAGRRVSGTTSVPRAKPPLTDDNDFVDNGPAAASSSTFYGESSAPLPPNGQTYDRQGSSSLWAGTSHSSVLQPFGSGHEGQQQQQRRASSISVSQRPVGADSSNSRYDGSSGTPPDSTTYPTSSGGSKQLRLLSVEDIGTVSVGSDRGVAQPPPPHTETEKNHYYDPTAVLRRRSSASTLAPVPRRYSLAALMKEEQDVIQEVARVELLAQWMQVIATFTMGASTAEMLKSGIELPVSRFADSWGGGGAPSLEASDRSTSSGSWHGLVMGPLEAHMGDILMSVARRVSPAKLADHLTSIEEAAAAVNKRKRRGSSSVLMPTASHGDPLPLTALLKLAVPDAESAASAIEPLVVAVEVLLRDVFSRSVPVLVRAIVDGATHRRQRRLSAPAASSSLRPKAAVAVAAMRLLTDIGEAGVVGVFPQLPTAFVDTPIQSSTAEVTTSIVGKYFSPVRKALDRLLLSPGAAGPSVDSGDDVTASSSSSIESSMERLVANLRPYLSYRPVGATGGRGMQLHPLLTASPTPVHTAANDEAFTNPLALSASMSSSRRRRSSVGLGASGGRGGPLARSLYEISATGHDLVVMNREAPHARRLSSHSVPPPAKLPATSTPNKRKRYSIARCKAVAMLVTAWAATLALCVFCVVVLLVSDTVAPALVAVPIALLTTITGMLAVSWRTVLSRALVAGGEGYPPSSPAAAAPCEYAPSTPAGALFTPASHDDGHTTVAGNGMEVATNQNVYRGYALHPTPQTPSSGAAVVDYYPPQRGGEEEDGVVMVDMPPTPNGTGPSTRRDSPLVSFVRGPSQGDHAGFPNEVGQQLRLRMLGTVNAFLAQGLATLAHHALAHQTSCVLGAASAVMHSANLHPPTNASSFNSRNMALPKSLSTLLSVSGGGRRASHSSVVDPTIGNTALDPMFVSGSTVGDLAGTLEGPEDEDAGDANYRSLHPFSAPRSNVRAPSSGRRGEASSLLSGDVDMSNVSALTVDNGENNVDPELRLKPPAQQAPRLSPLVSPLDVGAISEGSGNRALALAQLASPSQFSYELSGARDPYGKAQQEANPAPPEPDVVTIRLDPTGTFVLPYTDGTFSNVVSKRGNPSSWGSPFVHFDPVLLDGRHVHQHVGILGIELVPVVAEDSFASGVVEDPAVAPLNHAGSSSGLLPKQSGASPHMRGHPAVKSSSGTWGAEDDDAGRYNVCLWNTALTRYTGFTGDVTLGRTLTEVVGDDASYARVVERLEQVESLLSAGGSSGSGGGIAEDFAAMRPVEVAFLQREVGVCLMSVTVAPVVQTVFSDHPGVEPSVVVTGFLLVGVPVDPHTELAAVRLRHSYLVDVLAELIGLTSIDAVADAAEQQSPLIAFANKASDAAASRTADPFQQSKWAMPRKSAFTSNLLAHLPEDATSIVPFSFRSDAPGGFSDISMLSNPFTQHPPPSSNPLGSVLYEPPAAVSSSLRFQSASGSASPKPMPHGPLFARHNVRTSFSSLAAARASTMVGRFPRQVLSLAHSSAGDDDDGLGSGSTARMASFMPSSLPQSMSGPRPPTVHEEMATPSRNRDVEVLSLGQGLEQDDDEVLVGTHNDVPSDVTKAEGAHVTHQRPSLPDFAVSGRSPPTTPPQRTAWGSRQGTFTTSPPFAAYSSPTSPRRLSDTTAAVPASWAHNPKILATQKAALNRYMLFAVGSDLALMTTMASKRLTPVTTSTLPMLLSRSLRRHATRVLLGSPSVGFAFLADALSQYSSLCSEVVAAARQQGGTHRPTNTSVSLALDWAEATAKHVSDALILVRAGGASLIPALTASDLCTRLVGLAIGSHPASPGPGSASTSTSRLLLPVQAAIHCARCIPDQIEFDMEGAAEVIAELLFTVGAIGSSAVAVSAAQEDFAAGLLRLLSPPSQHRNSSPIEAPAEPQTLSIFITAVGEEDATNSVLSCHVVGAPQWLVNSIFTCLVSEVTRAESPEGELLNQQALSADDGGEIHIPGQGDAFDSSCVGGGSAAAAAAAAGLSSQLRSGLADEMMRGSRFLDALRGLDGYLCAGGGVSLDQFDLKATVSASYQRGTVSPSISPALRPESRLSGSSNSQPPTAHAPSASSGDGCGVSSVILSDFTIMIPFRSRESADLRGGIFEGGPHHHTHRAASPSPPSPSTGGVIGLSASIRGSPFDQPSKTSRHPAPEGGGGGWVLAAAEACHTMVPLSLGGSLTRGGIIHGAVNTSFNDVRTSSGSANRRETILHQQGSMASFGISGSSVNVAQPQSLFKRRKTAQAVTPLTVMGSSAHFPPSLTRRQTQSTGGFLFEQQRDAPLRVNGSFTSASPPLQPAGISAARPTAMTVIVSSTSPLDRIKLVRLLWGQQHAVFSVEGDFMREGVQMLKSGSRVFDAVIVDLPPAPSDVALVQQQRRRQRSKLLVGKAHHAAAGEESISVSEQSILIFNEQFEEGIKRLCLEFPRTTFVLRRDPIKRESRNSGNVAKQVKQSSLRGHRPQEEVAAIGGWAAPVGAAASAPVLSQITGRPLLAAPTNYHVVSKAHSPQSLQDLLRFTVSSVESAAEDYRKLREVQEVLKVRCDMTWRRVRLLGKGTFGEVLEVELALTGGRMAAKIVRVPPESANASNGDGPSSLAAIASEIKILSRLDHPHIVRYFYCERGHERLEEGYQRFVPPQPPGVGASQIRPTTLAATPDLEDQWERDKNTLYIFMELCTGGTLQDRVNAVPPKISDAAVTPTGSYSLTEVCTYMKQILSALAYIHSQNLVHRDLKPANVLINNGRAKLADFGTAVSVAKAPLRETAGTFVYMAPEVFAGEEYGLSCDIWSLGCVLLDMLGKAICKEVTGAPSPGMQIVARGPAAEVGGYEEGKQRDLSGFVFGGGYFSDLQCDVDIQQRLEQIRQMWSGDSATATACVQHRSRRLLAAVSRTVEEEWGVALDTLVSGVGPAAEEGDVGRSYYGVDGAKVSFLVRLYGGIQELVQTERDLEHDEADALVDFLSCCFRFNPRARATATALAAHPLLADIAPRRDSLDLLLHRATEGAQHLFPAMALQSSRSNRTPGGDDTRPATHNAPPGPAHPTEEVKDDHDDLSISSGGDGDGFGDDLSSTPKGSDGDEAIPAAEEFEAMAPRRASSGSVFWREPRPSTSASSPLQLMRSSAPTNGSSSSASRSGRTALRYSGESATGEGEDGNPSQPKRPPLGQTPRAASRRGSFWTPKHQPPPNGGPSPAQASPNVNGVSNPLWGPRTLPLESPSHRLQRVAEIRERGSPLGWAPSPTARGGGVPANSSSSSSPHFGEHVLSRESSTATFNQTPPNSNPTSASNRVGGRSPGLPPSDVHRAPRPPLAFVQVTHPS